MAAELRTREDFIAQVSRADTTVVEKNAYIVERCKGRRVLDLGCAPGSWVQVAAEIVGPKGLVVGIDLKPVVINVPANARTLEEFGSRSHPGQYLRRLILPLTISPGR